MRSDYCGFSATAQTELIPYKANIFNLRRSAIYFTDESDDIQNKPFQWVACDISDDGLDMLLRTKKLQMI